MELQQLLKECKTGSITAQKCLYDKFANRTFLLCRRYMKTDQDAEEMVGNGFLKFFARLHSFNYNNEAALWGWMNKIMVNECLMQLRKKNSFLLSVEVAANETDTNETALEKLSATEIFKLITSLPIGYRTVFNLSIIEGYTHKEIAAALGITEGTSKSQLSKARNLLQQLLQKNDIHYGTQRSK